MVLNYGLMHLTCICKGPETVGSRSEPTESKGFALVNKVELKQIRLNKNSLRD